MVLVCKPVGNRPPGILDVDWILTRGSLNGFMECVDLTENRDACEVLLMS